jgi:GNAT superfamily N-acetyltransferase
MSAAARTSEVVVKYQQIVEVDNEKETLVGFVPMDEETNLDDGVHPWRGADWNRLRGLVLSFLNEMYQTEEHRTDVLPTERNADMMVFSGISAAEAGDPCCALWVDGQIVGYTYWVGSPTRGLEIREKICSGLGTYIIPEYRRQGFATKLREGASEIAKKAGYARVDGIVHDKVGTDSVKKFGGAVKNLVMTRRF